MKHVDEFIGPWRKLPHNRWQRYWIPGMVPVGPKGGAEITFWSGTDNEENYRTRGNRAYGQSDIVYEYNSHGYRSIEPDPNSPNKKIMFVGCSYTEGIGLPYHEMWTTILTNALGEGIEQHNFGYSGSGLDRAAMTVDQVLGWLKPDLLVVLATHHGRKMVHTEFDTKAYHFHPHIAQQPKGHVGELHNAYLTLRSDSADWFDSVRSLRHIDAVARAENIPWVWQTVGSHWKPNNLGLYLREDNFGPWPLIREPIPEDMARDNMHPGKIANREFGESMAQFILEKGFWPK